MMAYCAITKLELPNPAFLLAPLEGVTDAAFRHIVTKYGKPDWMFTEFTSADGLMSQGLEKLLLDLWYSEAERPISAQIFGRRPEKLEGAARLCAELGFDGIDINMGCPDKNVCGSGSGAALIETPALALSCINAVKRGAPGLPVSVKTRIGYGAYDKAVFEDWVKLLLDTEVSALTFHLRTRREMSKVAARWEEAAVAVRLRDKAKSATLIFGNGDARDLDHAAELAKQSGVDGVMLGRAVFGNPWLFNREVKLSELGVAERLRVMLEHACVYEKLYGQSRRFVNMRKHFTSYVSGMPDASELRAKLTQADTAEQAYEAVKGSLADGFDDDCDFAAFRAEVVRSAPVHPNADNNYERIRRKASELMAASASQDSHTVSPT